MATALRQRYWSHSAKLCLVLLLVCIALLAIGCRSTVPQPGYYESPLMIDGVDPIPAPTYAVVV